MDNSIHLKSLRFLQWNARGLVSKKGELSILSEQFDIIAIQETWLNPNFYFPFPGFRILRMDSSRKDSSGLCFLIRNGIHFTQASGIYNLDGLLDTMGIEISTSQGSFLVIFLYKNPIFPVKYDHWCNLFSSVKDYDSVIIAGDSHNTSWGCASSNAVGK